MKVILLNFYEIILSSIHFFIIKVQKMKSIEKINDIYLLDSAMTHTIFCGKEYFSNLTLRKINIHTILAPFKIVEGSENITIILPNSTTLHLEDALLSSRSRGIYLASKIYTKMGIILRR